MPTLIIPYLTNQYPELIQQMKDQLNPIITISSTDGEFETRHVQRGTLRIQEVPCEHSGYGCVNLIMKTLEDHPNQTERKLLYPVTMTLHDVIVHLQKAVKPMVNLTDNQNREQLPVEWVFLFF